MRSAAPIIIAFSLAVATVARADSNGGYQSPQGIWLHGTSSPFEGTMPDIALASATWNGETYQEFHIEAGELRGQINGTEVRGRRVVNTRLSVQASDNRYVLTIIKVTRHENIYTCSSSPTSITADRIAEWEYQVEVALEQPSSSPQQAAPKWKLCGDNAALAVPGHWENGQLKDNDKVFTFACLPASRTSRRHCDEPIGDGGVIAKCIDYGYAPWATVSRAQGDSSQIIHQAPTKTIARDLHNLCTVAMRADYGGGGTPHTLGGTPIKLFDAGNVPCNKRDNICQALYGPAVAAAKPTFSATVNPSWPAVRSPIFVIEAVWGIDAQSSRAQALCLSKTRWETLDPKNTTLRRFCDDLEPGSLSGDLRLLISYSSHIDRGLYLFKNDKGDHITTSDVRADLKRGLQIRSCPTSCDCTGYSLTRFLGTVLSPALTPDQLASFDAYKYKTRPLNSYRQGCSMIVSTETIKKFLSGQHPDLNKYNFERLEGYLFSPREELRDQLDDLTEIDGWTLSLWHTDAGWITSKHIQHKENAEKNPLGLLLTDSSSLAHSSLPTNIIWKASIKPLQKSPSPGDPTKTTTDKVNPAVPGSRPATRSSATPR